MADETPPPPGAPGPTDRRRPAPTIDLKATEIASEPAAAAAPGQPPPFSPQSPPEQDAAAKMPPQSALHQTLSALAASVSWPLVGAGLAGAILTLGLVWVALSIGGGNDASLAAVRIAQLERQIADLAGRSSTPAANSASVGDLANRLQELEAQQAQVMAAARPPVPDPAPANRIAALETQLKSLGETVRALNQRSESNAAANATALNELAQKPARPDAP